jgi:hypothetical protein
MIGVSMLAAGNTAFAETCVPTANVPTEFGHPGTLEMEGFEGCTTPEDMTVNSFIHKDGALIAEAHNRCIETLLCSVTVFAPKSNDGPHEYCGVVINCWALAGACQQQQAKACARF